MTDQTSGRPQVDLQDMIAASDTGNRNPAGIVGTGLALLALIWSLFQLYYASNVPFLIQDLTGLRVVFNSDEARSIHLAFALLLAALSYPLLK